MSKWICCVLRQSTANLWQKATNPYFLASNSTYLDGKKLKIKRTWKMVTQKKEENS